LSDVTIFQRYGVFIRWLCLHFLKAGANGYRTSCALFTAQAVTQIDSVREIDTK